MKELSEKTKKRTQKKDWRITLLNDLQGDGGDGNIKKRNTDGQNPNI